ncbi:hypothetical protein D3C86_1754090 [compost metagenome]
MQGLVEKRIAEAVTLVVFFRQARRKIMQDEPGRQHARVVLVAELQNAEMVEAEPQCHRVKDAEEVDAVERFLQIVAEIVAPVIFQQTCHECATPLSRGGSLRARPAQSTA